MKIVASETHVNWKPYKAKRNGLLSSTDKYLLSDFPITEEDKNKILIYRQQLRDLFTGAIHPEQVIFPEWPI